MEKQTNSLQIDQGFRQLAIWQVFCSHINVLQRCLSLLILEPSVEFIFTTDDKMTAFTLKIQVLRQQESKVLNTEVNVSFLLRSNICCLIILSIYN